MAETETGLDRFANATPRPWHVYEGGNFVRIGAEGYDEYVKRQHYLGGPLVVAETHYNATENYEANHDKAMANARLIVAAVNSYSPSDAEQLIELRKALMGVRNGMGCWCKTPFVNISEDRPHEPRCLAVSIALNPSHSQGETQ